MSEFVPLPDNAPWYAKWIVANVEQAWRWGSVQIPAACALLSAVYLADPAGVTKLVHDNVPATWWPWISLGVSVWMMAARVTQVPPKPPEVKPEA